MRNSNIVASFLVLMKGSKILLHQRCNSGYHDGDYGLISGHVEVGETFTEAIIREANEEAGVTISPADLKVAHVMHRKSSFDKSERVDVYFLAKKWQGKVTNREPEKCSQLKWFNLNDLPSNMIVTVKNGVLHVIKNEPYSEYGRNHL